MSYILSRTTQKAPNLPDCREIKQSSEYSTSTNSIAVTKASLNQHPRTSDVKNREVFAGANISSISGCQSQIFSGPIKIIHESHKRVDLSSKVMTKTEHSEQYIPHVFIAYETVDIFL